MSRLAATALAAVLTACGGEPPGGPVPPPGVGVLREGRAEVKLRGAIRDTLDVRLDRRATNIFQPPTGGFALNWAGRGGEALGIGGPLFQGTRATGEGLSVTITAHMDGLPVVFASFEGECEVTVVQVERDGLDGTFSCTDLSTRGLVVDATGTFSAST